VTNLRSPPSTFAAASPINTRTDGVDSGCAIDFAPFAASGAAHSLQNLAPGLLLAPQRGHFATIGEAHSLQNFAPAGFSAEHCGQCISLKNLSALSGIWNAGPLFSMRSNPCCGKLRRDGGRSQKDLSLRSNHGCGI
jgi:hypothetical protein